MGRVLREAAGCGPRKEERRPLYRSGRLCGQYQGTG